jgi:hypothetical protein
MLYKPVLAEKIEAFLNKNADASIPKHSICCHHDPKLEKGTQVINTCAGCDRRFRELYDGVSTVSLWEVLAESETFACVNESLRFVSRKKAVRKFFGLAPASRAPLSESISQMMS